MLSHRLLLSSSHRADPKGLHTMESSVYPRPFKYSVASIQTYLKKENKKIDIYISSLVGSLFPTKRPCPYPPAANAVSTATRSLHRYHIEDHQSPSP